jgi:arylsulfatase A-like enzyme/Flp pilus assembly protein TadD
MLWLLALAAVISPPNVLLVTIDTLRADRVGAYGYALARTPAIDALAREGVLLEDAVVHVPQTRPSHASLFTGRYPFEHGLRDNAAGPLGAKWPTLAERLRAAGYDTGAVIGAYPVSRPSGLDRGFVFFDDPFGGHERATTREARSERRAAEVVDRATAWLQRPHRGPFFLWVHLFDPHAPYEPPPPFAALFAKRPYDGEVAYADAQLARLLETLDTGGRRESTLVVVTSDHGEGLGEHGEDEHMLLVYDSTLRVPLVLRWPGQLPAGTRVGGQFRGVDLLPTLLDLVGLPPVATSGASRAAQVRSGRPIPDNEAYAESLYGHLHYGWAPLRALRAEGWKYIEAPHAELYSLREDRGELRNRLDDRGSVAEAMRGRLAALDAGDAVSPAVDPSSAERLAALGYVGGSFFRGRASGADPKDKLGEFQVDQRGMREALRLYGKGDREGAVRLLLRLERGPRTSFNATYYLGRCLLELGRPLEAVPPLERAVTLAPDVPFVYAQLAEAQRGAGRLADAEATLARGLAKAPGNAELLFARGQLRKLQGQAQLAISDLERVRELEPEDARPRAALADLYRNGGRLADARAQAESAVRLDPGWSGAHLSLGLALGALGQETEAGRAFREALRLEPDQPDALFYLAVLERRAGRPADAAPLLERLVTRAPSYPGAAEALAATRREAAPPPDGAVDLRLLRVSEQPKAEALLRRLRSGEAFDALAREASVDPTAGAGGWLGAVRLVDLAEPLRAAAAALGPGETSGIVETDRGFVILKRER